MRFFTLRQWLILFTVQFATLLFGATMTSVAVILPQMKGALSATQDQVSWIITFNLVATAIATPLTGWLASKFGWRNLMMSAIAGFTLFSVLAGMAESLEVMLVTRVFQGLFGAPIFPLGQAIILASFSRAQHPLVLMAWGVGGVMGPILGPLFGGLMAELFNWRWAFYMIAPLGIIAMLFAFAALSNQEKSPNQRFDYLGFIIIAIAIGATQLMFDRGQRLDWLDSFEIQLELLLAGVFFYLFVVHMMTARDPLFVPATFTDRNFTIGLFVVTIMGMLQYTPMILFPPLLQELRGYPDAIVGYLLAARGMGNFISFMFVAQFTRISPRLCLFTGLSIQAVAGFWMSSLDINMTSADVFWSNILHGVGFGTAYTPMAVLTFSTLPMRLLTQGNAIFALLRLLGSSIFIALTLVVFFRTSAEANVNLASLINAFDPRNLTAWISILGDREGTPLKLTLLSEMRQQAAMIGYINGFHLLTLASVIAAPMAFLFVNRRN
ncbi:MAG: DHA2 family efflux MFS transporter permease subunit [Rhodospirillaceae bacterium]|jgi:MFS transporter, DHA2 family, multidrug resistance protein|nr:DHA2 family efflux MFS transporter permease subunit [Rhodospirillaceae bacterium]MBT5896231.1 DHA2 family efflux MFS transporter permease subunit [Rhodospirillaceae bacterium]